MADYTYVPEGDPMAVPIREGNTTKPPHRCLLPNHKRSARGTILRCPVCGRRWRAGRDYWAHRWFPWPR